MGTRSTAKTLIAAGILAVASIAVSAAEPNEAANRKVVDDFWAAWAKPHDAETLASFFREDGVYHMNSQADKSPAVVGRAKIAAFFEQCCSVDKGVAWKMVVHETLVRGSFVIVSYDDFPLVPKDPALAKGVRSIYPDMFNGEKPLMNTKQVAFFWIKDGKIMECVSSVGEIKPLPAEYSNVPQ